MNMYNESSYVTDVVAWEPESEYSRDSASLKIGEAVDFGTPLAKETSSGEMVVLDPSGADGTNVAFAVSLSEQAVSTSLEPVLFIDDISIIKSTGMKWGTMSAGEIATATAELLAKGIKIREAV